MPNYEFLCEGCGRFEQRRSFAEADDPMTCPSCGYLADRIYSMPAIRKAPSTLSKAMNRAEKSAYEPGVVRQPEGAALPGKRYHPGHGGHHGHGH